PALRGDDEGAGGAGGGIQPALAAAERGDGQQGEGAGGAIECRRLEGAGSGGDADGGAGPDDRGNAQGIAPQPDARGAAADRFGAEATGEADGAAWPGGGQWGWRECDPAGATGCAG